MCEERVIERLKCDIDELSSLSIENQRRINNINKTIHRNRKRIKNIDKDREFVKLAFDKVREAIGVDFTYKSEYLFKNKMLEFEKEKSLIEYEIGNIEREKNICIEFLGNIERDISSINNLLEKIKKETNEINH